MPFGIPNPITAVANKAGDLKDAAGQGLGFAKDHWQTIATVVAAPIFPPALLLNIPAVRDFAGSHWQQGLIIVASVGATVALTALLAPLGPAAPFVAAAIVGVASQYLLDGVANHDDFLHPNWKNLAVAGLLSVASAGVAEGTSALATRAITSTLDGVESPLLKTAGGFFADQVAPAAGGAAAGGFGQIANNVLAGKDPFDGVAQAALENGAIGLAAHNGAKLTRGATGSTAPALTEDEATALARQAVIDTLNADHGGLSNTRIGKLPHVMSAVVDPVTGEVFVGRSGGPLNDVVKNTLAANGVNVDQLSATGDVKGLKKALEIPAVRQALHPELVDAFLKIPDSKLTLPDGELALPWNDAEVQATWAMLEAGGGPKGVAYTAVYNKPLVGGEPTPKAACVRCQDILPDVGVTITSGTTDHPLPTSTRDSTALPLAARTIVNVPPGEDGPIANVPTVTVASSAVPSAGGSSQGVASGSATAPQPSSSPGIDDALGRIGR